jgi:glycosyltransferase involved in cell wall biosynthesis
MQGDPGVFLSACLMVKNEESNLPRCLESIKNIVDEIVVVDTGSTDRTIEIARSFGAVVFEHPWENDFSKHRNQTMEHASGEWCFIIDADEELFVAPDAKMTLKQFLQLIPAKFTASGMLLKDMQKGIAVMQFNSTRLFRKGTVRYEGIVHNAPQIKGSHAALCEFVYLKHYGYDLTPEQKEKKFERTNGLLRKRLEDNPNDYHAYFYLCQLYAESGRDNKEALIWGEKYLAVRDKLITTGRNNFNKSIYFTLFRLLLSDNQGERAKQVLTQGLKDLDKDLDLTLAIIEYGCFMNDNNIKLEGANAFLEMYQAMDKDPTMKENRFTYSHTVMGLAFALFHKSVCHLIEGSKTFGQLQKALTQVPLPMKQGYLKDFEKMINSAGLPIQLEMEKRAAVQGGGPIDLVTAELTKEVFVQ